MTVLVVDDSAPDRELVGDLLEKDAGLDVEYAADGAEALARIERALPHLVLTDLIMPQLNGLQLVAAVRDKYPLVPVILMTSGGSEELAVQALEQGAASYVPKRMLVDDLLGTVRKVLAVSSRQRSHIRLMGCMARSDSTFALENDVSLIAPLVTYLQEQVSHMGLCEETERTRLGVALEEALVNALYHGNLELGSDLRAKDEQAYYALIAQRRGQSPYRDRRIHVEASLSRRGAKFVVRDEGSGFDPSALPDPTDPANLYKASGRGVLLMRTFMDEVVYNDVGNTVTLTKRCAAGGDAIRQEEP